MLHSKPIIARRPLLLLIGFLAGSAMHLCAEVHISPFFSNNAVLQQKAKVPVWGTAAPSEKVTVAIQGQKASVIADQKGHWLVTLNEMPPGGPFVMTVSGNNTITLNDILVGEVWFCAGQSNMHLPVADAANGKEEVANANHPQIRLFNEMKVGTENLGWPEQDEHAQWQPCSPESVQTFSATAYYFGRELQKTLNVPIGLIHASVGGSKVEGWTSRDTLRTLPEAKSILDGWEKATVNYPKQIEAYRVAYADWKVKEEAARAQGAPIPKAPRRVYGPGAVYEPGGL